MIAFQPTKTPPEGRARSASRAPSDAARPKVVAVPAGLLTLLLGAMSELSVRPAGAGVLFSDGFAESCLVGAWTPTTNAGSVQFASGLMNVASSGTTFPYIVNTASLIPAGDFTLQFRLKYNAIGPHGSGIVWGLGLPTNQTGSTCFSTVLPAFGIWQDTGGLRFFYCPNNPCSWTNVSISGGSDTGWHTYAFVRTGANYSFNVDGVSRWTATDPSGNVAPLDIWMGNPFLQGGSGAWTSFSLDDVEVDGPGPASYTANFSFTDFSSVGALTLVGNAQRDTSVLRLASATSFQVGSAYYTQPVNVTGFSTDFRYRISSGGGLGNGADGLAFVVRGPGSRVPGPAGGNLGYQGVTPSVAVEVDVYQNSEFNDPSDNHIGIDLNGSVNSVATLTNPCGAGVSLKNGSVYHVWVDFDGSQLNVAIAPDGNSKPAPMLTRALCLPYSIGSVGFTAATANGWANHDILSWAYTSTNPQFTATGHVLASVVEKPTLATPFTASLPDLSVGQTSPGGLYNASQPSGSDGSFSLMLPRYCGVPVTSTLSNDWLKTWDAGVNYVCAADQFRAGTAAPGASVDFAWPMSDATNAYYLLDKYSRNYWISHIGVTPGPVAVVAVNRRDAYATGGGSTSPINSNGSALIRIAPGYAQYRDVLYHEFGHRMVIQALGTTVAAGTRGAYLEADGIDEGLADYFTAAYTGNPVIFAPSLGGYTGVSRSLAPVVPYQYTYCEGVPGSGNYYYYSDAYYGARLFGGALWQMRNALMAAGASADAIDQLVYGAVNTLAQDHPNPAERTFNAFRHALEKSGLGLAQATAIDNSFAAHNIMEQPSPNCFESPSIASVAIAVSQAGQKATVIFKKVTSAQFYRGYLRQFVRGAGFEAGLLVADSLTDSTFTYTDPDTTDVLAFVVTAVDANGNEGPIGPESPMVTAVEKTPEEAPNQFHLRVAPNPSRGGVQLAFTTRGGGAGVVRIYDVGGRLVRRVEFAPHEGEEAQLVNWDGRDSSGRIVRAGVYLIRVSSRQGSTVARAVLVR